MGFDLRGVNPTNERGNHFHNNSWFWRPLWDYVCDVCADILTERQFEAGNFNDGILIDKRHATQIADKLDDLIACGEVKRYQKQRKEKLAEMPDVKCEVCKGKGKRNDEHIKGKCNACNGRGKCRPWETEYEFEEENVKKFAAFARDSGGFEIC